jgi:hypothetical protein
MNTRLVVNLTPGRAATSRVFGLLLAAGLTIAGISGCSKEFGDERPPGQPVNGQVLLDGKPLTSGDVVLVSATYASEYHGQIGADGHFTIKTGDVEGAPEGEYRVRIDPEPKQGTKGPAKRPATRLPYPGRYADETTSDLTFTVKPGNNDLELKLTKSASKSKTDRDDSARD